MLSLIQHNLVLLALALVIGLAAGRWIFAKRPSFPDRPPNPDGQPDERPES